MHVYLCTILIPGAELRIGCCFPGTEFGCESSNGCWEMNPDLLEEKAVLLTLVPQQHHFLICFQENFGS